MDEFPILACPECGSRDVTVTEETMFKVNTGEHYCHTVKMNDGDANATCLSCRWDGKRHELKEAKK